ncbi:MAG: ATP-binding protein [Pseudomonadota bacterium]|nr:ATP-binding protein [Pseudomonadota bacterium]
MKPRSLRARLLWFILAAIVLTAALQAGVTWRTARAEADVIFDYQMQQTALALRSGLPLSPGPPSTGARDESGDQNFEFVVQVWTADGLRIFESASRAALPQRAQLGFTTVRARGSSYRVYSMATPTRIIQVAQDLAVRREMAGTLALRTALPIALLAPLLMLAVWWVVSASMAPVTKVQRQLALRRADALDEIVERNLPAEIEPLVAELNALLGRVRQAFDAQSRFVADAAHELRSPLAALKLQAQALQRAVDESTRAVAAGRLAAGIDRATRLVEQLLVLARQQALATAGGAGAAALPRVALTDLVRQGVADASEAAELRHIDLGATRLDEATLPGQAEALRMLLRNLLDNALRHTPEGGRIDVALRQDPAAVCLTVEDSGPGIPESERARVFDRFYRSAGDADGAQPRSQGSGLGLAIVKSIADLHRATLTLGKSASLGGLSVSLRFVPPPPAALSQR